MKRGVPLAEQIKTRDRSAHDHCKEPGCINPVKSLGLCGKHYARFSRYGTTGLTRVEKHCSIPDCDELVHAKGLCTKHYYRELRTGSTEGRPAEYQPKACAVGNCQNMAVARDMCQKHYMRWQRHAHVLETQPADWGSREKHPLYTTWNSLLRYNRANTCERWYDLWQFVADIGNSRPSIGHLLKRKDDALPFSATNFYWLAPSVSSLDDDAKARHNDYRRAWYAANADKVQDAEMQKRYGIGFDDYKRMFEAQDGKCAICRCEEARVDHRTKKISRMAVDHDHTTGAVRGLLCHHCNVSLGGFKDDPNRLEAALAYLKRHAAPSYMKTLAADGSPRDYLDLVPGSLPAHLN
jgi:hypothetical protein